MAGPRSTWPRIRQPATIAAHAGAWPGESQASRPARDNRPAPGVAISCAKVLPALHFPGMSTATPTTPTDSALRSALAARVKNRREQSGKTQLELAQAVGITRGNLNRIEAGHSLPRLPVFIGLATALGVTLDDLGGTPPA